MPCPSGRAGGDFGSRRRRFRLDMIDGRGVTSRQNPTTRHVEFSREHTKTEGADTMKRLFAIGSVIILALAAAGQVRAQSDPGVGTWKVNLAKSKYNARTAPRSEVRTYVMQGDAVKLTVNGVAADGSRVAWGYTARLDGKDYPITGSGPAGADAIAATQANASTVDATMKKGGKAIETATRTVSSDGKTMTATAYKIGDRTTPLFVTVYDKQ